MRHGLIRYNFEFPLCVSENQFISDSYKSPSNPVREIEVGNYIFASVLDLVQLQYRRL